jgi:hypothetical protein
LISIFHETKIPMVDMKVQVYSKFRKNKIRKKVKSPISMRIGTCNTSKCRKTFRKIKINSIVLHCLGVNPQPAGNRWSPAVGQHLDSAILPIFFEIFFLMSYTFCTSGQLLLVGSSTCLPWPDLAQKLQTPMTFEP